MANTSKANSFAVVELEKYKPIKKLCSASYAGKFGDVCYLDANGRATATAGIVLGIQVSGIISVADNTVETTASASAGASYILVIDDVNVMFRGQISTFTQTDSYTTRSSAACYDVTGSAGAQYVDAAASTNDIIKVIGIDHEHNTGEESAVGANAKCLFKFNPLKHYQGPIA